MVPGQSRVAGGPAVTEFLVTQVGLPEDAIELTFIRLPDDIRDDRRMLGNHNYAITNDHPEFRDQIKEIRELVTDLAEEAHRRFQQTPPPPVIDEDEDEEYEEDEDEEEFGG